MAPSGGIWAPLALRALKKTIQKTSQLVQNHISEVFRPSGHQPILLRLPCHQPVHSRAIIRQNKRRLYTTQININATVRRFLGTISSHAIESRLLEHSRSRTTAITSRFIGKAPFSSALRPKLTAGAFPRTAGGYSIGGGRLGGARYFSSTPTPPAQVVQDVLAAFRILSISKKVAPLDNMTSLNVKTQPKIYDSGKEDRKQDWFTSSQKSGSYVDFRLEPNLMSLSHLTRKPATIQSDIELPPVNLNTDGLLEELAIDCSRAMKDLSQIMVDLQKFSILGDLPITLEETNVIRVHFLGHDLDSVERICQDIGIQRGIVGEHEDCYRMNSNQIKLFYPLAPDSSERLSPIEGSLQLDSRICSQDYGPCSTMEKAISESIESEYFYINSPSLDENKSWYTESIQSNHEGDHIHLA